MSKSRSKSQFNFNPEPCGPNCSQETPNHEKLRMISWVKKKISPKNRHECNQKITVAKIEEAIKSFENKISPDNDGLPT